MAYLHPIVGALTLGLLVWLALLGFRSRHRARYAAVARKRHRTVSTFVLAGFALAAVSGGTSTAFLRDDLAFGASLHVWAAVGGVISMIVLWVLGTRIRSDRRARRLHPWVGWIALGIATATAVLGMRLLP